MSSLSADPWGSAKPQTYPYDPLEEDGHAADAPHAHAMEHDVVEVHCTLMEELAGNYLKHHLYSIDLKQGVSVVRRYSDFSWLNAYLLKTYAFRLIPPLPPKRLSVSGRHLSDSGFLGRRAKGLARFSSALLSHHVFKADPVVLAFYSRPELDRQRCLDAGRDEECWRSLAPAEEAAVPHELEDRLLVLKTAVVELAAVFTRHCQGLERAAKRSEAEAQDCQRLAESSLQAKQHIVAAFPASSHVLDRQLVSCSRTLEVHSAAAEESATRQSEVILQRYKAHRELYSSFRDLLARHQVQAPDAVDKLRGKVASAGKKLEAVRTESKAGWEVEASKLEDSIKADEQRIAMLLRRRLFIRYALWQEVEYLSQAIQSLSGALRQSATHAQRFASAALDNWSSLSEQLA